jgi:Zinc finger, C2H2 type
MNEEQNQDRQQSGQMKCQHCGRSFKSQEELRTHQQNCTGQQPKIKK